VDIELVFMMGIAVGGLVGFMVVALNVSNRGKFK